MSVIDLNNVYFINFITEEVLLCKMIKARLALLLYPRFLKSQCNLNVFLNIEELWSPFEY